MTSDHDEAEVLLSGEVVDIQPARTEHPHIRWTVKLRVDSVNAGDFSSKELSFGVHSPERSGVQVGGTYLVHLKKESPDSFRVVRIEPLPGEDG